MIRYKIKRLVLMLVLMCISFFLLSVLIVNDKVWLGIFVILAICFYILHYNALSIAIKITGAKLIEKGKKLKSVNVYCLRILNELANEAGIKMPQLYIMPVKYANAFAVGRNKENSAIILTEGLISKLSLEELKGVISHEVSHIKHDDTFFAFGFTLLSGVFVVFMALLYTFCGKPKNALSAIIGFYAIIGVVGLMIILIPLKIIEAMICRLQETAADHYGGILCRNPLFLANALEKLEIVNKEVPVDNVPALLSSLFIIDIDFETLFSTHPNTKDRIEFLKKLSADLIADKKE